MIDARRVGACAGGPGGGDTPVSVRIMSRTTARPASSIPAP